MRGELGCFAMAALLWSATAAGEPPPFPVKSRMYFPLGYQRVVTYSRNVRGFGMREEDLLKVRPWSNNQILLVGRNVGYTPLLIFGPAGPILEFSINVLRPRDPDQWICDSCKLLPRDTQITLDMVGDHIFVRGIANTLEEVHMLKIMVALFSNVTIQAKLAERPLRLGLLQVSHALWREGFLDARAVLVGDQVMLSGHFASSDDEARAQATLAPYAEWLEDRLLPIEPTLP